MKMGWETLNEMRKENGGGRERESATVPAMSLEICFLLLNHFPL